MTTLGMDTTAARAASNELEGGADQIAGLAQRLDGLLLGLDWVGPDAERVRADWQHQERPRLDATAQHLHGLVALLRGEAEAQDVTSGEGGTGAGAGAAPPAAAPAASALVATEDRDLGDWLAGHLGAFLQGAGRTLEQTGDLLGKVGDVLTGEHDWSVAAIAASAVATAGSAVGTIYNGVTGKDHHWFDDRPGQVGAPVAVPTDPAQATRHQPALTPPRDLPTLMQGVSDGYQVGQGPGATGDVRITRVDNGGVPAYVVAIPGTESWNPSAGGQPRDLTANVALVGGRPSAAAESVERAMAAAGIPAGSPVMLVGHSQGGIIAAQLASDPGFVQRHGVTHVMTYGAPVDHVAITPGVDVLQVQHGADVVPRLDLGGVRADGSVPDRAATVTLDSPGPLWAPATNHSYTEYLQSVRDELGADTAEGRRLRDYQQSAAPFLVGAGGSATAVDVPVSRGDD